MKNQGLFILDNANNQLIDDFDKLPKAPNWHILVTSRERIVPFDIIELDFLPPDDAITLFKKYNNTLTDEQIRDIVKSVEYHTLAIEILAKSSKKQRWDVRKIKSALTLDAKADVSIQHSQHHKIDRIRTYLTDIFNLSHVTEHETYLLKHFINLPNEWIAFDFLQELLQIKKLDWQDDFPGTLENLYEKGFPVKR